MENNSTTQAKSLYYADMTDILKKYGDLKMVWHPAKLASLRDGAVSAPICVRIKPTNRCDHRCFYCSYDPEAESQNMLSETFSRHDEIPSRKLREILDDFRDMGVKAVTFSGGGEPLLHPYIESAMRRTLEGGLDLSIITNGQRLSGEKARLLKNAKWVRISLDACKADTFSRSRGIDVKFFNKLVKNLADFAAMKESFCELGINFVVHHINSEQLYEAARFFKDIGVNHIKYTPRWIDDKRKWLRYHAAFKKRAVAQIHRAKTELADEKFAIFDTYENDFKLTGIKKREYSFCPIMQIVPVIGADSMVYFCHDKTYTKEGALGSLKNMSFRKLWFSKKAAAKFREFNPMRECRHHCTYDARNIFMTRAIKFYDSDSVNFP